MVLLILFVGIVCVLEQQAGYRRSGRYASFGHAPWQPKRTPRPELSVDPEESV